MRIHNFQGDFTDISAKKEPLLKACLPTPEIVDLLVWRIVKYVVNVEFNFKTYLNDLVS